MFVFPSDATQAEYGRIVSWVVNTYPAQHADTFLGGADPWVVAQAKADEAVVVTHEKPVAPNSKKPKIPNTCEKFGIVWIDPFELFRSLGGKLILG